MGNVCGGKAQEGDVMVPVGISDEDLMEIEVSTSNSEAAADSGLSGEVDLDAFNGTWVQSRTEGLEEFFTHMKVPWMIKKLILKVTPKQQIEFSKEGFSIQMSGGPKTPKPEVGKWGESFSHTNPRGLPVTLLIKLAKDPVLGTCVKGRSEHKEGVDLFTRYMQGDEMVLEIGPKRSLIEDGKVMKCRRYFKRSAK